MMTLRQHREIECEGERSPYQLRADELRGRLEEARARREREDRRLVRLHRLRVAAETRWRTAFLEASDLMADLRFLRTGGR